jgi:peptide/nickel transport system permease protein
LILKNGTLQKLLAKNSARVGIITAGFLLILTLIAPLALTFEPNAQNPAEKLLAPSFEHLLGTDQYGRDVLARIAGGALRSLGAAILVSAGTLFLSLIAGITVGMLGGIVDSVVMRVVDVFLALPSLVLALAVVGVLGVGFENLLIALVFSSLAYYMRLTRSYALNARNRQDVIVARLAGVGWTRIIFGHIAPGILTQMLIVATLDLGGVIVAFAGLSFLGLGVQPPDAEWGAMLNESRLFFTNAPWLLLAPAAAIFLSVMAANLIGNALRDASGEV